MEMNYLKLTNYVLNISSDIQNIFSFKATLILNGLSLSFSTLQTIFNSAPSLRVLHLSKTQFPYSELNCSDLEKTTKNFISKNLEELHLNDCEINNWHRVLNVLFYFPKLERFCIC